MGEHCRSTEFSSAAEFRVTACQELFEIGIHFSLQNKNKSCATKRKPPKSNTVIHCRKEQLIRRRRLNHRHSL